MSANVVYSFASIAPGQTVSVFVNGYNDRQAVTYSAVVFGQSPSPWTENKPAETRAGHVTLTQGETFRWIVDGTIGRKIYVRNEDTNAPVRVDVLQIIETTGGFHPTIADFTTLNK